MKLMHRFIDRMLWVLVITLLAIVVPMAIIFGYNLGQALLYMVLL